MEKRSIIFALLITSVFALNVPGIYGATGRIKGRITDSQRGESLHGANIFIVGTGFGAASDKDGFYLIRQVPPGSYELRVTYIGYQASTIPVQVQIDQDLVQANPKNIDVRKINATDIAFKKFGQKIIGNIVIVGYLAALLGIVSKDSIKKSIRRHLPQKVIEANLNAFEEGYNLGMNDEN